MKLVPIILWMALCMIACSKKQALPDSKAVQHNCMSDLTEIIVRDVVSPPVASRMYAYTTLAFYEGIRHLQPTAASVTQQLKGFESMPLPEQEKKYHFPLVAAQAFYQTAHALVFSKDSLLEKQKNAIAAFKSSLDEDAFEASLVLGDSIAAVILRRSKADGYKQTRGLPRYHVYRAEGRWYPTPPDYMDAIEPYWNRLKPLLLDSASQCKVPPPPAFDLQNRESVFYKEMMETKAAVENRSPEQDTIARYWDDNAYVTEHKGHLVYATKKTTPGGHWMGITSILSKQTKADEVKTAKAFALTAAAIYDGFIACWDEKYRSNRIRPVTAIRTHLQAEWWPILQTPPFPEYTSGHSVISSAAATVLTQLFGENLAFTDTTELPYLGMKRSFTSIRAAADETCISRLYGGIHFRSAIEQGKVQGNRVGELYSSLQ